MKSRLYSTDQGAVNLSSWFGGGRQVPAITLETTLLARVAPAKLLHLLLSNIFKF